MLKLNDAVALYTLKNVKAVSRFLTPTLTLAGNPCKKDNGGCSDDCTFEDGKAMCSCEAPDVLKPDHKTCIRKLCSADSLLADISLTIFISN